MDNKFVKHIEVHDLAAIIKKNVDNVLIIDSRSFLEYNTCHISNSVNVCCSKIVKRRLQQDKVTVKELLVHTCQFEVDDYWNVVVYDQGSQDALSVPNDSFISVLLKKLVPVFASVNLLVGGFLEFQAAYPSLCEDKTRKCAPLTSLSQPCLPISNHGPTRILPFLYLGSQYDAQNKQLLKDHNITYELNVSTSCPKPDFIQDNYFMRIPVNDNYSEKLLPYFYKAFHFLDKVRESSGCVLVHCLAGISRSPTIAIAYVMKHLRMTSDDAYRYVKSKRPTISPNFNFLGQLLEYEKQLQREKVLDSKPEVSSAPVVCGSKKRLCPIDRHTTRNLTLNIPKMNLETVEGTPPDGNSPQSAGDQSPTRALAKLSFGNEESEGKSPENGNIGLSRSMSCNLKWLGPQEDENLPERVLSPVFATARSNMQSISGSVADFPDVNGKRKDPEGIKWTLPGIPYSSLNELNFTSCQTSESKSYTSSHFSVTEHSCQVSTDTFGSVVGFSSRLKPKQLVEISGDSFKENKPTCGNLFPQCTEYKRSDSVSTSGLGSESSDCQDSWYSECQSSSDDEREKPFAEVVLRKNKTTREPHSHDSAYKSMGPDDDIEVYAYALDPKDNKEVPSPLSPSEKHFLEDFGLEDELPVRNTSTALLESWKTSAEDKENSRDSGFHSSLFSRSFGMHVHAKSSVQKEGFEEMEVNWTARFDNKVSHTSSSDCHSSSSSTASQDMNRILLGTFRESKLENLDGLQRAQSCPGILGWLSRASSLDGSSIGSSLVAANLEVPRLRRSNLSSNERASKFRNRYSCGSLDYTFLDSITCESCPDGLHVCCQKSPGTASLSPARRVFRRSANMIEVS